MAKLITPKILHGGDYNPDQWLAEPAVLAEDLRLMKLAGVNAVSLGIFSWVTLEPAEGQFEFAWLDRVMEGLASHGVQVILATPSGSKPAWLSQRYPEVCRCQPTGHRDHHAGRHNHCPTSPVYRDKVQIINAKLAERYARHPALMLWHVSNEYGGECHCSLCKQAFRDWLQRRYGTLDAVNRAWWSRFWSHTYTDWSQIDFIDGSINGLVLDWKRFVTDQTVDFFRHEITPLKQFTPQVPVTTNMMGTYAGLNYWKFVPHADVVGWDSYPDWHGTPTADESGIACQTAFTHDIYRAMKPDQPWLLFESTPSQTNWHGVPRAKRPGLHRLASLQAVAHGADAVLYFQWRKGQGGSEKFHGAVVDHVGHEHTRVFREVAALGAELESLAAVAGTTSRATVALIYDWENRWAIDAAAGPRNLDKDYEATVLNHYRPYWRAGVTADVIAMDCDFTGYRLLVAPMLYMVRPGVAERISEFVRNGGTYVATYLTGYVDQSDLCFRGGFPGPLRPVLGLWNEECDILHAHHTQTVLPVAGNGLGLSGSYAARHYCEVIHLEGGQSLANYGSDYYARQPAVTVNRHGAGHAYYIAARTDDRFLQDFHGALIRQLQLPRSWAGELPAGVCAQRRGDRVFLMNFSDKPQLITGAQAVELPAFGAAVLPWKNK